MIKRPGGRLDSMRSDELRVFHIPETLVKMEMEDFRFLPDNDTLLQLKRL